MTSQKYKEMSSETAERRGVDRGPENGRADARGRLHRQGDCGHFRGQPEHRVPVGHSGLGDCVAIFCETFWDLQVTQRSQLWRRVMAFGAPAGPIANVALIATSPARPVRTQRGVRTPLADDSTPGRDALCETSDRRYRVDLRSHTRRSGFRGRLDSLAHSLPVSQRRGRGGPHGAETRTATR